MSAATANPQPPTVAVDVSTLTRRVERASKVTVSANAPQTPAGAYGSAIVTTGTRPVGSETEDCLVILDGSARLAFPQSAVLLAVKHDVIPREIIRALWAAADAVSAS